MPNLLGINYGTDSKNISIFLSNFWRTAIVKEVRRKILHLDSQYVGVN